MLLSRSRKTGQQQKRVVRARKVAMWLMRNRLGLTYKEIAKATSRKDHTTVLAACRDIDKALARSDTAVVSLVNGFEGEAAIRPAPPAPVNVTRLLRGDTYSCPLDPKFGHGFVRATAAEPGYFVKTSDYYVAFVSDGALEEAKKRRGE